MLTIRHHLTFLCVSLVVLVVVTMPLAGNMSNSIIGSPDKDSSIFYWDAWRMEQMVFGQQGGEVRERLFSTHLLFFPTENSTALHTQNLVSSFLTAGLNRLVGNLALSYNVVFAVTTLFGSWCLFMFFALHTRRFSAATLGALFAGYQHLWGIYAWHGTQNLLSLWLPAAALLGAGLFMTRGESHNHRPRWWAASLMGAVLGLALWQDFIVFCFAVSVVLVYALAYWLICRRQAWRRFVSGGTLAIICLTIIATPYIWLWQPQQAFADSIPHPSVSDLDNRGGADIVNLFRPSPFHPVLGLASDWITTSSQANGNAYLGIAGMLILILGAGAIVFKTSRQNNVAKKGSTKWGNTSLVMAGMFLLAWGLVYVFLAAGPHLRLAGILTDIPLPTYFLVQAFPVLAELRYPARFVLVSTLFMGGTIAMLWDYLLSRFRFKTATIAILTTTVVTLMVFDQSVAPLPLSPVSQYAAEPLDVIARTPNAVVMDLPLQASSGYFSFDFEPKQNLVRQTWHRAPIIGGHLSRLPFSVQERFAHKPVLGYLNAFMRRDPDADDLNPNNISDFMTTYTVTHIIIDTRYISLEDARAKTMLSYLDTLGFMEGAAGTHLRIWIKM